MIYWKKHSIQDLVAKSNRRQFILSATVATVGFTLMPTTYPLRSLTATAGLGSFLGRILKFVGKVGLSLLGINVGSLVSSAESQVKKVVEQHLGDLHQRGYRDGGQVFGPSVEAQRQGFSSTCIPMQKTQAGELPHIVPFFDMTRGAKYVFGSALSTPLMSVMPYVIDILEKEKDMGQKQLYGHLVPLRPREIAYNELLPDTYYTNYGLIESIYIQDSKVVLVNVMRPRNPKSQVMDPLFHTGNTPGVEYPFDPREI